MRTDEMRMVQVVPYGPADFLSADTREGQRGDAGVIRLPLCQLSFDQFSDKPGLTASRNRPNNANRPCCCESIACWSGVGCSFAGSFCDRSVSLDFIYDKLNRLLDV